MEQYTKVRYWIEDLPKRGKITFSQEEVEKQFPDISLDNIRNSLYRLVKQKKIQSVWRGFFVVVPIEYALRGVVAPIEYIDQLMKHLNQPYYIGLLSAAAMYGAAHQQPMALTLITDSKHLRDKTKNDVKISFFSKKEIPDKYIKQMTTRSGYIQVSIPELTAMDLIMYVKQVGGINRTATILNELAEIINFENIENDFFNGFNVPVIQRLGYLLDELGYNELSAQLLNKTKQANLNFRNYPLNISKKLDNNYGYQIDNKWKIIINGPIEIDE
jgi:predicted transcriptional regulator of viral defense system